MVLSTLSSSLSGQKRCLGLNHPLHSLQGTGDSAPAIPHLCEFSSTFQPKLRKITRHSSSSQLYKSLFTHWLMVSEEQERRLAESSGLGKRKKLPFWRPLSCSVLGSQSHIWYPHCLNIGFLLLLVRAPPWCPTLLEGAGKLSVPKSRCQTERGIRTSRADVSPYKRWIQKSRITCPSLSFISPSAEDHLLLLNPGNVLPGSENNGAPFFAAQ